MAASAQILREYLVALGFQINQTENRVFDTTLGKVDKRLWWLSRRAFFAGAAVQAMVAVWARGMERLYYSTQKAEASAGNLRAFDLAARSVGVSSETMQGAIEGMARALRLQPGLIAMLEGNFGIKTQGRDKTEVMLEFVEKLKSLPFYTARQYAEMFGIDPDTLLLLQNGLDKFKEVAAIRRKMAQDAGLNEDKAAEAAVKYSNSLRMIAESWGILKDSGMMALLPFFQALATAIENANLQISKFINNFNLDKSIRQFFGAPSLPESSRKSGGAVGNETWDGKPLGGDTKVPLGIRNNNPGNLRSWGNTPITNGFAKFGTSHEGLSAMAGNLLAYQNKHGLNTIRGVITRWAPPGDNNDTESYIRSVVKRLGRDPDAQLNLNDPATLSSLMEAIIKHENGTNPYDRSALDAAASSRLLGRSPVTIQQKTDITVMSDNAETAGRAVAREQDKVNANIVRNAGQVIVQ